MKTKKGTMSLEQIIKWILLLVGLSIIIWFTTSLFDTIIGQSDEQACRTTIAIRENTKINLHETIKDQYVMPAECITKDIVVPEKKTKDGIREKAMEDIADHIALCWWMFGNGNYHNVLEASEFRESPCHVCYSFTIPESYEELKTNPITIDELKTYLNTHSYKPGILQGATSFLGSAGKIDFAKQTKVYESSRESRKITIEKILEGKTRLQNHIADFSDVFSEDPVALGKLRTTLYEFNYETKLEPAIIIISTLDNTYSEDKTLPLKIMEQWGIGDEKNNGIVLIFSLAKGELYYATESGTDVILPKYAIEKYAETSLAKMDEQKPKEAIQEFITGLLEFVKTRGTSEELGEILSFQNSYSAYVQGGMGLVKTSITGEEKTQGVILWEKDLKEFKPGTAYAIAYASPKKKGAWLTFDGWNNNEELSNGIVISNHFSLVNTKKICDPNY